MSALLKPITDYSLSEYYALEKGSDRRWEYWEGEIVCMSGGTKEHGRLTSRLHILLGNIFERKGCESFTGEQAVKVKVSITSSGYVYPDVSAGCDPNFERHIQRGIDLLVNPSVIVEVVSQESISRDYENKKDGYLEIPSLRDYLIVEPNSFHITHWKLVTHEWKEITYDDINDVVELASIDETLSLSNIYSIVFSRRKKQA